MLTDWIGLRLIKDLRDDVYAKFLELPLGFYHRYRAGELISRATHDVQIANKTINVSFTNLVRDPAQILGYVVICLWISVTLTLLALVILPGEVTERSIEIIHGPKSGRPSTLRFYNPDVPQPWMKKVED